MSLEPVLIAGEWRESEKTGTFQAANPASGELLAPLYPISSWADCEAALESAHAAFFDALPERVTVQALRAKARAGGPQLDRMCATFVPLSFSRGLTAAATPGPTPIAGPVA